MKNDTDRQKLLSSIGTRLMAKAKSELCLCAFYLSGAVGYIEEVDVVNLPNPLKIKGMATNGTLVVYDSLALLNTYEKNPKSIVRQYAHLLLHCIYRHYYKKQNLENHLAWDVACDIAVEYLLDGLEQDILKKDGFETRQTVYDRLSNVCTILTAEHIYAELNLWNKGEVSDLKRLFCEDDHVMWIRTDGENLQSPLSLISSEQVENESDQNSQAVQPTYEKAPNNNPGDMGLRGSDYEGMRNSAENWKRIAERIRLDIENFSQSYGNKTAFLTRTIDVELKTHYDYREFLKRFMVLKDILKEDPLEFDYIYYNLGLTMYGNLPLLDSLEYVLDYTLEQFVVAIDTSGSVFFDTVVRFLEECYSAIAQSQTHRRRIELHIIQCDCKIKEDVLITGFDDFTKYMKSFKLIGGGGTDFRPVFDHIAKLQEGGKLEKLKGIIYFTDGIGRFPDKPPKHDVAFVFYGDMGHFIDVPSWAMKLVIDENSIA